MKKNRTIQTVLTGVLLLFLFVLPAQAAVDSERLLEARTSVCWVEGEIVGDWVLGARGSIEFVYMDLAMSNAMIRTRDRFNDAVLAYYPFENWLEDGLVYFGNPGAKGKALFIAYVTTKKPWDFDPAKVHVGDYYLNKNDVLTPSWANPFGELPSELEGWFAFVVPKSAVKAGQTVKLGYGDYNVDWKAPK